MEAAAIMYSTRRFNPAGCEYALGLAERLNLNTSTDIQGFITRAINAIGMRVGLEAVENFITVAKSLGYAA